jgi:hypothetical protein
MIATHPMPPPPDESASKPVDWMRKHYDEIDAQQAVRGLERDYGIRMRYVPCKIRRRLYHIEFYTELNEIQRAILVRYCDGYQPQDMVPYFPGWSAKRIGDQLSWIARESGLMSRHHLITLAVFFGEVTPSILAENGDGS